MEKGSKINKKPLNLLVLAPYPEGKGPSQRFRLEIYFKHFEAEAIHIEYHTFLDERGYDRFYAEGSVLFKFWTIFKGLVKRTKLMFQLRQFDKVFVQREVAPLGPPIFEWLIAKVWAKPMIYDIDDAIWLPNVADVNARFQKLKCYRKIDSIMKWSSTIIAGNSFLAERARLFNSNVHIIPTVVDAMGYHVPSENKRSKENSTLVLGWTGTHSSNRQLEYIAPVLKELAKEYRFKLLVISNKRPNFNMAELEYRDWNIATELKDLHEIDIGLMPLIPDFEFAEGKCGFKAIQFMALGLPVVANSLGMNAKIINHQENGFLCDTLDQWRAILVQLLSNSIDCTEIKKNARATVLQEYSLQSQKNNMISAIVSER